MSVFQSAFSFRQPKDIALFDVVVTNPPFGTKLPKAREKRLVPFKSESGIDPNLFQFESNYFILVPT